MSKPARFILQKGFVSFLGINNSGKSSLLKFFHEFQDLFRYLRPDNNDFVGALMGRGRNVSLRTVQDPDEVFSNTNEHDIDIEIRPIFFANEKYSHPTLPLPDRVCVKYSRQNKLWTAELTAGGELQKADNLNFQNEALYLGGHVKADLSPLTRISQILSDTFYVPSFRNVLNIGTRENYYDIQVGESLIRFWDNLKNGFGKKGNEYAIKLEEDLRHLFGYKDLAINPQTDNQRLQLVINKKSLRMDEIGSGLAQFFIVLANAALKKPTFILIDEPELNLHPALQLDFLTTLASYASEGVIFATHSIGLARASSNRLYSVQRIDEGVSKVTEYEATPNLAEFAGSLSFSSYKELGFEKILLVEGPNDVTTIQQFLRLYGKEHEIMLIHLGGQINSSAEYYLEEIKRISTKLFALVDSEKKSENASFPKNRLEFKAACEKANISCHILERRAIENYFTESAIKKFKGEKYRALLPFEKLNEIELGWDKAENWRIAREMTKDEINNTDLGKFLEFVCTNKT